MSDLSLTASQVRYVNKAFWRNPSSAFFTFAFPLMFLVIFTALLGNSNVHIGAQTVKTSTYYVASMACFAVITACYNNVAINLAMQPTRASSNASTPRRCRPSHSSPPAWCMPFSLPACSSPSRRHSGACSTTPTCPPVSRF